MTYTFTGYYPSGNPFLWLYDEYQKTMFTTSIQVSTWDREPKIGEKIRFENDGKIFIGEELVFTPSEQKKQEYESKEREIYDNVKRSKGLI